MEIHVNKDDVTNIANAIRTVKGESSSVKYKLNEMDSEVAGLKNPSGTINITENGTVDVTNYANANVNVTSDIVFTNCDNLFAGNRRLDMLNDLLPLCKPTTAKEMFSSCSNLTSVPLVDLSNCTDVYMFVGYSSNITECPILNTSNVGNFTYMFAYCSKLVTFPSIDTSKAQNISQMCNSCTSLENFPVLNFSSLVSNSAGNCFVNCPNLTNQSLNNIMESFASATTSYWSGRSLKTIGLSETQATTCTTLSNWSTLEANGWITGY